MTSQVVARQPHQARRYPFSRTFGCSLHKGSDENLAGLLCIEKGHRLSFDQISSDGTPWTVGQGILRESGGLLRCDCISSGA